MTRLVLVEDAVDTQLLVCQNITHPLPDFSFYSHNIMLHYQEIKCFRLLKFLSEQVNSNTVITLPIDAKDCEACPLLSAQHYLEFSIN